MIVGHIGSGSSSYEIQKSLRFRAGASAYLSRTPSAAGNRKTWTWSGWVKRGALGRQRIFSVSDVSTFDTNITFLPGDTFSVYWSGGMTLTTTQVFRDPSAWYHFIVAVDTTQVTASDRVKAYVNGAQVTAFSVSTYPAQNSDLNVNSTSVHNIGRYQAGSEYLDGYLSEINFIDGQALDPSYFGEVSAETGAWIPKKYTGTYGANGFYLPFNDGSSLANLTADRSGNGNNWTANNISLTAGATYDWMDDTPSNNFAVWNPINVNQVSSITEGNLRLATSVALMGGLNSTVGVSSGKWYWEIFNGNDGAPAFTMVGVRNSSGSMTTYPGGDANGYAYFGSNGNKYNNGGASTYGSAFAGNQIIGVALDLDANQITFYLDGVSQGVAFTGVPSGVWFPAVGDGSTVQASNSVFANFGQRPFAYTPPAGFKALCTKNLPAPSILNPKKHFDVVLATGANIKSTAEAVFPSNFLEWIKDRGNANNHQLIDIVRGTSAVLQSNTTAAETTYAAPSGSSVAWLWKAGGAPVTNSDGSIQSQVSANPQAGFSIVTFTTPASGNITVGHGLGKAPGLICIKNRGGTGNWVVYHSAFSNNRDFVLLNLTNTKLTNPTPIWADQFPSSSTFGATVGGAVMAGAAHVAYCFSEIPGYSKFGSYTGNGNADGPFVYCGFRPRYVMAKSSSLSESWIIFDTARNASNTMNAHLYPHLSSAETISAGNPIDITANGFKLRGSDIALNGSGATYIFAAFAEQPFQFANAR